MKRVVEMRNATVVERLSGAVVVVLCFVIASLFQYILCAKGMMKSDDSSYMWALSAALSLSIIVGSGISFPQRMQGIVVWGVFGLVVGLVLSPQKSSTLEQTLAAVAEGDIFYFRPFWTMLFACIGTIAGQNLVEIRELIARANR